MLPWPPRREGEQTRASGTPLGPAYGVLSARLYGEVNDLSGSKLGPQASLGIMQEVGYLLFLGGLAGLVGLVERARRVRRLKEPRRLRALSQEELADESGVGRATISRIEWGETGAHGRTLRRLAAALGWTSRS